MYPNKYFQSLALQRNTLAKTIEVLERGWNVSFEIKPTGISKDHSNIFHATTGARRTGVHGARTPAMYFVRKSTKILICTSINDDNNFCRKINNALPLNKYSKVSVKQIQSQDDFKFYFQVFVNNISMLNEVNDNPQIFNNVKYYLSNPWKPEAKAFVKNFVVETYKDFGK